jgi:pimeloyl-ACP methyl ester carboxylesterase
MQQMTAKANGIDFAYLEAGPADGPLALCLHGFPDTAHSFRHLLPALADAGYHAVAPWLRGYAPTGLAPDDCYQAGAIGSDACALHEALGGDERAVLIGHDWGAFGVWSAAPQEPQRWRRVVAMAVPPLPVAGRILFTYEQLRRSFYVFLFQTPLADLVVPMDDLAFIERLWADWSPGYDGSEDVARVKESLRAPENLSAALAYYRSMFDGSGHQDRYAAFQTAGSGVPPQPTLYLHGADDGCYGAPEADELLAVLAAGSEYALVADAGHFLHVEQPAEVNGRILTFLSA